MKLCLIIPRLASQKGDFFGSGVPYWPLEAATLAAFLRQRGNDITVLDLFGEAPGRFEDGDGFFLQGRPLAAFRTHATLLDAEMIVVYAISFMAFPELSSIGGQLKQWLPNIPLLLLENSQAVTGFALDRESEALFGHGFDGLILGEPYAGWSEIEAYFSGAARAQTPPNLALPSDRGMRRARRVQSYLHHYPVPAWDLLPLHQYWRLPYAHGPKSGRYLPLLTSRGCPFLCDFCVSPATNGAKWHGYPPEVVVDEMLALKSRFAVTHFQIEDLNPTVQHERFERLAELLIEREARITFALVSGTKAETIRLDSVPLLARAGCRYLSISPESGARPVLKAIGKPFRFQHGLDLVAACRRHGIFTQACFVTGHPAETEADHQASRAYLKSLVRNGLDEVAVFILAPFPGSALADTKRLPLARPRGFMSFSPRDRTGWPLLVKRRSELIRTFLIARLWRGTAPWKQLLRAFFGRPATKLENLPRRLVFVWWGRLRHRLKMRPEKQS